MLRALIWDVDGTLAETEFDGHREAFNAAFAEAGLTWHWDEDTYASLLPVTGGKERIAAWWQRIDPDGLAAADASARIAALHAVKTRLYADRVARGQVALRPGIARLLDEAAAAGLRLAIATTTTPANVQALLTATMGPGAMDRFEVVGAGDVVPAKKPAPDIYHWVLHHLGLPPAQTLAIEDSRPGAEAALAAGVPTVVLRSRMSRDERWPAALREVLAADPLAPERSVGRPALPAGSPRQWPDPGAKGMTLQMLRRWHADAVAAALHRAAWSAA